MVIFSGMTGEEFFTIGPVRKNLRYNYYAQASVSVKLNSVFSTVLKQQ